MTSTALAPVPATDLRLVQSVDLFLRNNALCPNTQQTYGRATEVYLEWLGTRDAFSVSLHDALDYREYLTNQYSHATAASYLSAIKAFYKLLAALSLVGANVWALVKVPKVPNVSTTRALTDNELEAATASVETWSNRDRLIFRLLHEAALRREEVVTLTPACLEQTRSGYALRITGKGSKVRLVGITDDIADAIKAQVKEAGSAEWVFPGRISGHLHVRSVNLIIDRLGDVHPHQLRHTHVTQAHEAGAALADISNTVGHADPRTTMRYLDKRDAVVRSTARTIGAK